MNQVIFVPLPYLPLSFLLFFPTSRTMTSSTVSSRQSNVSLAN